MWRIIAPRCINHAECSVCSHRDCGARKLMPTTTHGGALLQPQTLQPKSVPCRRVCFNFSSVIDCNSSRRTQAGVLPVCDKFSSHASSLHGHDSMRRKRAGLFPAYDHSPQAHGLGSTQRNVRRVLAVQFCSCGVESRKASQTPGQAERSPLAAVGKTRLVIVGRLIAAGVATGHEQSFSHTPRGATVHIPLADCISKCRCAAGPYMEFARV